uniref:Uncharacterized protein n=1 Tax=Chromera velia CCMP2878 TaxID=1169474 RepID=A0A0G4HUG3_9ALVE|eukprot:Cvel_31847.t1-p1 / transcript=Cvel_31847.t1 / gene=Cvel_31847 / organism=Chromera_velia_CCMP2878 / gene_product=hypothetical protein / transcript_product=hypothetical protein / location=Cvel_scaffold4821:6134-7252(+) / protein_length=373 / sequence_SO=supercontig / SO=protein_coding / is_pseudo=false
MGNACGNPKAQAEAQRREERRQADEARKEEYARKKKEEEKRRAEDREAFLLQKHLKTLATLERNKEWDSITPPDSMPSTPDDWKWNVGIRVYCLGGHNRELAWALANEEDGIKNFKTGPEGAAEGYTQILERLEKGWAVLLKVKPWVLNPQCPLEYQTTIVTALKESFTPGVRKHFAEHPSVVEAGDVEELEKKLEKFSSEVGERLEVFEKEWRERDAAFIEGLKDKVAEVSKKVEEAAAPLSLLPHSDQANTTSGNVKFQTPCSVSPPWRFSTDPSSSLGGWSFRFSDNLNKAFESYTKARDDIRKECANKVGLPLDTNLDARMPPGALCVGRMVPGEFGSLTVAVWEDTRERRSGMGADEFRLWCLRQVSE